MRETVSSSRYFFAFSSLPSSLIVVQMTTTTPAGEIVFSTIPSLTTCAQVTIEWTYNGTTSNTSFYPLFVTNIGIDQGDLSRRVSPPVPGQNTAVVNMTLSLINPLTGNLSWPKVNVPQGRYRLDVHTTGGVLSSNTFSVTSAANLSSSVVPSHSSTPSINYTSTPPPSSSTSLASSPSVTLSTQLPGNLSVNKRIIAGSVISGAVVLVLIAAIIFWVFHRRKTPADSAPRTRGQTFKGPHNPSDSMGKILPFNGGNQENFPQLSTSEEDFGSEKSAVAYHNIKPNPPPIAATKAYSKYSRSSRRPVSMAVQPSFESRETAQSASSRRQPHRSLDSSPVPPNSATIPPSPSSPSHPRYPSDRARRTSRKPVPVYDPNEFPSSGADDIPLSARFETSLGSGKKTHYLIPDPPLGQRK